MVQADLKSQTVLVTGANGFVGRSVCASLLKAGYTVRAAVRHLANFDIPNCEPCHIQSIDADTDWSAALDGVTTVIHLAARVHVMHDDVADPQAEFHRVNVAGTERLALAAAASGVKRIVYVSSIGVNGLSTAVDQVFSEIDKPCPHNAYAISKWEAEQSLMRLSATSGLEAVIVRPPLVYGPNAPGNFAHMVKVVAKNIPLPLASVRNLRSLIYVENLADALILCATHQDAVGQTYLLSDGADISTPDLLRQLGAKYLFACPLALLKMAGGVIGKGEQVERLLGSLRIDSGKIRSELNWHSPYTLQEGLRKTRESFATKSKINWSSDERK
ncbi:NAD-dependent epimerase/dehydratase family protein [Sideroxydans sp.]